MTVAGYLSIFVVRCLLIFVTGRLALGLLDWAHRGVIRWQLRRLREKCRAAGIKIKLTDKDPGCSCCLQAGNYSGHGLDGPRFTCPLFCPCHH